ncbi:hypothetical protein KXW54_004017 [Aspergillus fumigatus]|nr:hypothetical protein KXX49_005000 [Aspergillus fumigatus]KAH2060887.1 hypothetical protein KXW21_001961 [Aspergillus fumigatus]KAH2461416.1 hypothetical protein KXV71_005365 [Aspergillus fumigatus]KAH2632804.1 hypothetical protein KXW54_004017 [Aspergillus fumigatus]KAH2777171.1 hypothetical protein KXV54_004349 [Aspergillus fumigatus]
MPSEPLSPALNTIVDKLSDLIKEGKVSKAVVDGGWRYYGETFQKEIENLKNAIIDGGNKVVRCHATHFTRGAYIQNPTFRLILIQINGTSKLDPGGLLQPGSYQYLEDSRTLICEGEGGVDIGVVVLAENTSFKKV